MVVCQLVHVVLLHYKSLGLGFEFFGYFLFTVSHLWFYWRRTPVLCLLSPVEAVPPATPSLTATVNLTFERPTLTPETRTRDLEICSEVVTSGLLPG